MSTTPTHPLLKFLAKLPQFQTNLLMGGVLDMRSGAFVSKYDGGDEPKHTHTLSIRWPGQAPDVLGLVEGEKYARLQVEEAVALGADRSALVMALQTALS